MQALHYGGWQQVDLCPQRWNVWSPEANDRALNAKSLSSARGYPLPAATIPARSSKDHRPSADRAVVLRPAHSEVS